MEFAELIRLKALGPDKWALAQQMRKDRSYQEAIDSMGALPQVYWAKQAEVERPRRPKMTRSSRTFHVRPGPQDRRRVIQPHFPVAGSDRASDLI